MQQTFDHIEGYIFDWDGTLIDTIHSIEQAYLHAARDHCLPDPCMQAVRKSIGSPPMQAIAEVFPDQQSDTFVSSFVTTFRKHYQQHQPSLIPGAKETLYQLHAHGKKLAIASNKELATLQREIHAHGLSNLFHCVQSVCLNAPKPSPAMLQAACDALGLPPHACCMVGDHHNDVLAAKAMHMPCIAVLTGSQTKDELAMHQPNYVFASVHALITSVPSIPEPA